MESIGSRTPTNLGSKIVHGGAWVAALHGSRLLVNLLLTVVVARLLEPSDLGLLGMALLAITITRALTETGFEQALVQRQHIDERILNVAWSVQVSRGVAATIILAATAGAVGMFFNEPRAAGVLRALSATVLLDGLTNICIVLLHRRLAFKMSFIYHVSGLLADMVVTITLAFAFRNVWALVFGKLAGSTVRLATSYLLERRRPRFDFDRSTLAELFRYGRWLTVSSLLMLLLLWGDDLFVGKVLGAAMLGYYQIAYKLSNLPATTTAAVISTVMFPAYSSIQDDLHKLRELFVRAVRMTAVVTLPASALIFSLAQPMVEVLLGEKWLATVEIVKILAVFGALRSLGATSGPLFLAMGRPQIRTMIQTGQLIILGALIYPMSQAMGLTGVALTVLLHALIFNIYAVWRASRLALVPARDLLSPLLVPMAGSLAVVVCEHLLMHRVDTGHGVVDLALLASAGCVAFAAVIAIADRVGGGVYRQEVHRFVSALKRRSNA